MSIWSQSQSVLFSNLSSSPVSPVHSNILTYPNIKMLSIRPVEAAANKAVVLVHSSTNTYSVTRMPINMIIDRAVNR
jgi:hypothetical protein